MAAISNVAKIKAQQTAKKLEKHPAQDDAFIRSFKSSLVLEHKPLSINS